MGCCRMTRLQELRQRISAARLLLLEPIRDDLVSLGWACCGCGCDNDEYALGCPSCRERNRSRQRRGHPAYSRRYQLENIADGFRRAGNGSSVYWSGRSKTPAAAGNDAFRAAHGMLPGR